MGSICSLTNINKISDQACPNIAKQFKIGLKMENIVEKQNENDVTRATARLLNSIQPYSINDFLYLCQL